MKTTTKTLLALLALGASALAVNAQDANKPQGDNANGPRGHRPPVPAIVMALDVNHDGVIDSNEIANASAELKTLDKNGDGQLTPDEFMGPRPQRPGGPDQNSGGNRGDDRNQPPGPPPGDNDGNTPSGPPPQQ
ncbi:MAG TPA: EF-hand domain-containing protein [Verrucomicrobiae bacterium]|nr:EF-hand domain-containing protein [Verrucomicrobiae bacterium]